MDFHGRRLAFEAGIAADVIRPVGAMIGSLYAEATMLGAAEKVVELAG